MTISRETLMALVDGELGAADEARARAQVAKDPALAAYVAEQEKLRAQLRDEFASVLGDPVAGAAGRGSAPYTDESPGRKTGAPRRVASGRAQLGALARRRRHGGRHRARIAARPGIRFRADRQRQ